MLCDNKSPAQVAERLMKVMAENPRRSREHLKKKASPKTAEPDDVEIIFWVRGSADSALGVLIAHSSGPQSV